MKQIDQKVDGHAPAAAGLRRGEGKKVRPTPARNYWFFGGILTVLAIGAFFRLMWLGEAAFRADTIIFYDFCHRAINARQIFFNWFQMIGPMEHFPFPLAFTKGFIDGLHLPVTDFVIRLPSALFGALTVLFAFLAGRELSGRRFGLFFALLLAVSPFHIQLSREAYFYPPLVLGAAMQCYSVLWLFRRRRCPDYLPWHFYALAGAGFFLLTYSHLSGWWLAVWVVPVMLGIMVWRVWRIPGHGRELAIWLLVYGAIGIPLLFIHWGLPYVLSQVASPEAKAHWLHTQGPRTVSFDEVFVRPVESLSFGSTVLGVGLIALAGLGLGACMARRRFWNGRYGLVLLVLAGAAILYVTASWLQARGFDQRHLSMIFPLFLVLITAGLWHVSVPGRWLRLKPVIRRLTTCGVAVVAVGMLLPPAWWSVRITGKPAPFKEIARWCDTQLPPRTLVLVERWFDPWNELRVHNSTNVYFTFTVPAEPPDVFERNNWPATAKQFFNRFPDAAYLEYCSSERNRMGVISNVYFARQVTFTNVPGIKLGKYRLAYRGDFYDPATNRLLSTIFYNTREDVIRHAREQGQTTLVLYAPSWGYVKLWQQLKDFRDWRVLEDQATLDIYNLTDRPNSVSLVVSAMAANGSKRVRFGALGQADFQNLRLAEWRIERVLLKPGLNSFMLKDEFWALSKVPLLVDRVDVLQEKVASSDAK